MKDKFIIGLIYGVTTAGAVFLANYLEPRAVMVIAILSLWAIGILLNQYLPRKK